MNNLFDISYQGDEKGQSHEKPLKKHTPLFFQGSFTSFQERSTSTSKKFYEYYNSNSGKDASRGHVDTKDYYINQQGIPDGSYQIIAFDADPTIDQGINIDKTSIEKIAFTSTSQTTDISFAYFLTLSDSSLNASDLSSNLFVYVAATNMQHVPSFAIGTIYGPKYSNSFSSSNSWYNTTFTAIASGAIQKPIVGSKPRIRCPPYANSKIFIIILIKKNDKQIKFTFNP